MMVRSITVHQLRESKKIGDAYCSCAQLMIIGWGKKVLLAKGRGIKKRDLENWNMTGSMLTLKHDRFHDNIGTSGLLKSSTKSELQYQR